jgi:Meckel syndrome type 1 protein
MERNLITTEAQQLLDAAFAGNLDLDADASQAVRATNAESGTAANPEETKTETTQEQGAATQDDEKPAPIASKSGEYTIPYDKLVEARQQRDQYKAEVAQLREQLASLTAAQASNLAAAQEQARADAGQAPTQADQNLAAAGVDVSLFGDFSEEAIAKGVAALVEQRAAALVDAKLAAALAPFQQREAKQQMDAHMGAIYAAHPDADEVFESAEFKRWMSAQPAFARVGIEHAMTNGEAKDVIDVFSAFKAATGKGKPADAVTSALEKAQTQPPTSLSELPGAAASGATEAERVAALASNPAALLDFMAGLSPEKQNRLMNSVV